MKSDRETKAEDIASEIARYIAAHPDAADTAEGIQRWWLPRLHEDDRRIDVEKALELLLKRRLLEKRLQPDGAVVYSRA